MERREVPQRIKNHIFELLQAAELDDREFAWEMVRGAWAGLPVSQITHRGTGFFLRFDVRLQDGLYYPTVWPGTDRQSLDDDRLKQFVGEWVRRIAPELKAPDLWKLAGSQAPIGAAPDEANTAFSEDDQNKIAEELSRLEQFVYQAEPSLPEGSRRAIAARFSYLKQAAARLGRVDWASIVIGQLFAMVTEKLITVQTFTGLYSLAATLFSKVLMLGSGIITKLLGG
jgi:hypothetical protein